MGGSAFTAVLPSAAFPRIPPTVYRALKSNLQSKLSEFYDCVGVPQEAPEKVDYGDLDLLVTEPKPIYGSFVPHEVIKQAIGAKYVNAMDGNRTSNYAIPIALESWKVLGHGAEEQEKRHATDDGNIYYQVDVNVASDKNEYDRRYFFHSYGDLGMILGLIGRNSGLALGSKGLTLPDPPNPPLDLSASFNDIISFLGLSMQRFKEGFKTREEVYEWVASSKYFDPHHFQSTGPGFRNVKAERAMYHDFIDWVALMKSTPTTDNCWSHSSPTSRKEWRAKVREETLLYFKKKEEYDLLLATRLKRLRLKESFSGSRVRDWASLGEYWKGVKLIMDEVRERLGGDDGVFEYLDKNTENDLRLFVLQVKDDLAIQSLPPIDVSSTLALSEEISTQPHLAQ